MASVLGRARGWSLGSPVAPILLSAVLGSALQGKILVIVTVVELHCEKQHASAPQQSVCMIERGYSAATYADRL